MAKRINSRRKGKDGELELVAFLKAQGIEARRGQQFRGGGDSPDVIANGCLSGVHIECKRKEAGSLYEWLKQAIRDASVYCIDRARTLPVVMHRKSKEEWVAILRLEDFIAIMKQAEGNSNGQAH